MQKLVQQVIGKIFLNRIKKMTDSTEDLGTFQLHGVDYNISDLSEEAKYIIAHLHQIRDELDTKKIELYRAEVTFSAFIKLLEEAIEKGEEPPIKDPAEQV